MVLSSRLGIAVAIVLGLGMAQVAAADSQVPSYAFGVDVNSKYFWRGFVRGDDVSAQPYAQASFNGLNAGVMANKTKDFDGADEVDLSVSYGSDMGPLGMTFGYTNYQFTGLESSSSTNEVFVQAQMPMGAMSPTVAVYHDWDMGDGTYVEAGMAGSFFAGVTTIGVGAMLGYNSSYFMEDYSGFSHGALTASMSLPFGTGFSMSANVGLNKSLDTEVFDDQAVFGIGMGWGN